MFAKSEYRSIKSEQKSAFSEHESVKGYGTNSQNLNIADN